VVAAAGIGGIESGKMWIDDRLPCESHGAIDSILAALKEALTRCRGPEEVWMVRGLKRAMVLVGGLDEETAQSILDQEGI